MSNYLIKEAKTVNNLSFLDRYMIGHNGFIAGDCFKNIFQNEKVKDIDIFFKSYNDWDDAVEYYNNLGGDSNREVEQPEYRFVYTKEDKVICFQHIKSGMKIELVCSVFGTPKEILKQFDFTITKYALFKENEEDDPFPDFLTDSNDSEITYKVIYHSDFFEHIIQKKLVLDENIPFPVSTFQRILRYTKYGYNLCHKSSKKIIDAMNKPDRNELDDINNSFYGGGWD